jgi:hypothetical protein
MLQRKNPKIKCQAPKKKSKNQIPGSKEKIQKSNIKPQRKNPKIKYQAPKKKSKNQISGSKEKIQKSNIRLQRKFSHLASKRFAQ